MAYTDNDLLQTYLGHTSVADGIYQLRYIDINLSQDSIVHYGLDDTSFTIRSRRKYWILEVHTHRVIDDIRLSVNVDQCLKPKFNKIIDFNILVTDIGSVIYCHCLNEGIVQSCAICRLCFMETKSFCVPYISENYLPTTVLHEYEYNRIQIQQGTLENHSSDRLIANFHVPILVRTAY